MPTAYGDKTGVVRNRRAKEIAMLHVGYKPRITRGRGTASGWLTVTLKEPLGRMQQDALRWALVEEGLAGTYESDGPDNVSRPKVSIEFESKYIYETGLTK